MAGAGFRWAAALALAGMPAIAHGQDGVIPAESMGDLRCAIWAANLAGAPDAAADQVEGFGYMLTYFIGRFEGQTGRKFDEVATFALVAEVSADPDTYWALCEERAQDVGNRMVEWGERVSLEADTIEAAGNGS